MATIMSHPFGKDHHILFDFEALWQIEQKLGPLVALLDDPEKMAELNTIGVFIWGGLLDCSPEITEREARKLISEVGIPETQLAITKGFEAAWPDKFQKKKAPGKAKPKA